MPDLDELRGMVNKNTKLICINNPNNPTGALMEREFLQEVAGIARSVDAWLLCDEVYRGLNHEGEPFTASVADLYEKRNFHGQYVKDLFIGRASSGLDRRVQKRCWSKYPASGLQYHQLRYDR